MDCCVSHYNFSFLPSLPSTVKTSSFHSPVNFSGSHPLCRPFSLNSRSGLVVVAATSSSSNCEFSSGYSSSLNTPLEPKSPAGKFLSSVLQNDLDYFHVAAGKQLENLLFQRDQAVARLNSSFGSDEECLHRRISELTERDCEAAVEDVMYMLVLYKFTEIRVHMVPRLYKCMYNGRLEIWPSKDWELESIHSFEVLEMIREHLSSVVGWKAESNVTYNWTTTKIQRLHLCRVYAASILYGYFLKSASLRHHLELSLAEANHDFGVSSSNHIQLSKLWSHRLKSMVLGHIGNPQVTSVGSCSKSSEQEKLRGYVMGFDLETLHMCAKPKSKEAVNLIERHTCALFGDEKTGLPENDEVISTSLASLKRFVLEAVAFGSFLWDTEEYVNSVYKLKENYM